jgi:hypothetical protein
MGSSAHTQRPETTNHNLVRHDASGRRSLSSQQRRRGLWQRLWQWWWCSGETLRTGLSNVTAWGCGSETVRALGEASARLRCINYGHGICRWRCLCDEYGVLTVVVGWSECVECTRLGPLQRLRVPLPQVQLAAWRCSLPSTPLVPDSISQAFTWFVAMPLTKRVYLQYGATKAPRNAKSIFSRRYPDARPRQHVCWIKPAFTISPTSLEFLRPDLPLINFVTSTQAVLFLLRLTMVVLSVGPVLPSSRLRPKLKPVVPEKPRLDPGARSNPSA